MDPTITVAIISVAGTVAVAIIGKISWDKIGSIRFQRKHPTYKGLMKTVWKAEWYYEDGSLYVEDEITFQKWKMSNRFAGVGNVNFKKNGQTKKYTYSIEGEVSPTGFIVLTYKAEKYPEQANIGVACLSLATDPTDDMEGFWSGRCSVKLDTGGTAYIPRGGRLKMSCIKDLK